MGGHDFRVNLIINYGRQIGRSLLLLAHYVTVFVSLAGRSVTLVILCAKWMMVFVHHAVAAFDTLHSYLHWWSRRGGAVAMEICPGSDTESAESD